MLRAPGPLPMSALFLSAVLFLLSAVAKCSDRTLFLLLRAFRCRVLSFSPFATIAHRDCDVVSCAFFFSPLIDGTLSLILRNSLFSPWLSDDLF